MILATIAGMTVAMVWYSNWGLFAKPWEKQTGITSEKLRKAQGRKPFIILLGANFVTAVALALAITIASTYFNDTSVWLALATGFVLWLGLSATTLLQHNTFEMKSIKLTVINTGYQLALFLVIALVVGILSQGNKTLALNDYEFDIAAARYAATPDPKDPTRQLRDYECQSLGELAKEYNSSAKFINCAPLDSVYLALDDTATDKIVTLSDDHSTAKFTVDNEFKILKKYEFIEKPSPGISQKGERK